MMETFKSFITLNESKLQWEGRPDIGWWEDKDVIRLYHGTHIRNVDSVVKNGLTHKDPQTGMISLALEPNTAFGYAAMAGVGGEASFRKAGAKVKNTPAEERAIFVLDIPMKWIKEHYDPNLSGNVGQAKEHMKDKSNYTFWNGSDVGYYSLAEIRVKTAVPAKYIKGYMIKP